MSSTLALFVRIVFARFGFFVRDPFETNTPVLLRMVILRVFGCDCALFSFKLVGFGSFELVGLFLHTSVFG